MGEKRNATVIDFIYDSDHPSFQQKRVTYYRKEAEANLILPLRVIALLIAVSGLFAMIFEVRYFEQFSAQVYVTRLLATLVAFTILVVLYTRWALRRPVLLVHLLLITIILSSGYMILLIPSTLIVNSQIVGLMIFTTALFLSWELSNQIIVAIYYNIVFAGAILLNDKGIYFLPNMYESVLFVLFLSVVSVIGSAVNYRLRLELAEKSFRVKLSEEKFRSIIEHSAEGIFQSSPEGRYLTVNPALVQILGYASIDELKLVDISRDIYVDPNDRLKLLKLLEVQGEVRNYRVRLKRKDGRVITVRLSDRVVSDPRDENKSFFEGSLHDITDQVRLEEERRRTEAELKTEKMRSDKLAKEALKSSEIKGQFLANMSHEIRTPINGILGFLTLIESGSYRSDMELKEFISNAKGSAESLLDIVNDILDFSKIEAGKMQLEEVPFNMQKVINEAISIVSARANEKGIKLSVTIDRNLPLTLLGDMVRMRQIFINLLSNAVKFTERGEVRVLVSAEKIEAEKVRVQAAVRDSGVGIPEEKIAQLFKPFSQIDGSYTRKFGGTGLGLAICRELVTMMSGTIWAETNKEGRGSTFSFTALLKFQKAPSFLDKLRNKVPGPSAERDEARQLTVADLSEAKREQLKAERGRFRILVAEDNPVNKKVVLRILADAGFVVNAVSNGLEAFNLMAAHNQYSLILMDVQMPEMDGFTATTKIRALNTRESRLPIIALTAHALAGDREKCLAAGMNDYITKPIKNDELIALIDKYLEIDYAMLTGVAPAAPQTAVPSPLPIPEPEATVPAPSVVVAVPVQPVPPVAEAITVEPVSSVADAEPVAPAPLLEEPMPPAPQDEVPVFDREHFNMVSLENAEFQKELLETYLDDTARRLELLRLAIEQGNAKATVSEGHTIKGASFSVGAKQVGEMAKEIEMAARAEDLAAMQLRYRRIVAYYQALRAEVQEYIV